MVDLAAQLRALADRVDTLAPAQVVGSLRALHDLVLAQLVPLLDLGIGSADRPITPRSCSVTLHFACGCRARAQRYGGRDEVWHVHPSFGELVCSVHAERAGHQHEPDILRDTVMCRACAATVASPPEEFPA